MNPSRNERLVPSERDHHVQELRGRGESDLSRSAPAEDLDRFGMRHDESIDRAHSINFTRSLARILSEVETNASMRPPAVVPVRLPMLTASRLSEILTLHRGNIHFTDAAAREFIASRLEDGHPVEVVELRKPAGATGYVMKIDIEPARPILYVKLQLGSGKIIGRSFHYSDRSN